MARRVGEAASTVDGWKARRRIASKKQAIVLQRGVELGLGITAEDVMFPFPEDRPAP